MSIVVAELSSALKHNLLRSRCVDSLENELIVIDNLFSSRFPNLATALNRGLARARFEAILVVHEDVVLPDGWHGRLDATLSVLEASDPDWGIVGVAGTDLTGRFAGHLDDPSGYRCSFGGIEVFREVAGLDGHLLLLQRRHGLTFDEGIAGQHGLGDDLALAAQQRGLRSYVVNAPTVRNERDEDGRRVFTSRGSRSLRERRTSSHQALVRVSKEYLGRKWKDRIRTTGLSGQDPEHASADGIDTGGGEQVLDRPLVLLGRGGSGTRLLSLLALDLGVFLGRLNASGDSTDLAGPIYEAFFEKEGAPASFDPRRAAGRLRSAARRLLLELPDRSTPWGFKVPESLLVLDEISAAFPQARFIHLVRDPILTCLRRSHLTARVDNPVGRLALPLAYDHCNRDRAWIAGDPAEVRMACTTAHQLSAARGLGNRLPQPRFTVVHFEDVVEDPEQALLRLAEWTRLKPKAASVSRAVDRRRAGNIRSASPETEALVRSLTSQVRQTYERYAGSSAQLTQRAER